MPTLNGCNATNCLKDEGPVYAACLKRTGGKRYIKRQSLSLSDTFTGDDRKGIIIKTSKYLRRCQNMVEFMNHGQERNAPVYCLFGIRRRDMTCQLNLA